MRGIKWTPGIARQADVHAGAEVLPNENGSAPGLYLCANIKSADSVSASFFAARASARTSADVSKFVMPILSSIVPDSDFIERRSIKLRTRASRWSRKRLAIACLPSPESSWGTVRVPGEVDVRIVGKPRAIEQKRNAIVRSTLGSSIFSAADETLEEVIVKLLAKRNQTLAVAESCTGGLLSNRTTNVPGASAVFLAGYVCYANQAKIDMLNIDPQLIEKHGAVSERVASALAEHARASARSDYALAYDGRCRTGRWLAGEAGRTVYIALAASDETIAKKLFFPTDRETFKQIATQAALNATQKMMGA